MLIRKHFLKPSNNNKSSVIMHKGVLRVNLLIKKKSLLLGLLVFTIILTSPRVVLGEEEEPSSCIAANDKILAGQRPQMYLIPEDPDNLNKAFTSTTLKVNVEWSHIHDLLDTSCVQAYLIEYGVWKKKPETREDLSRSKRESSVQGSAITTPQSPETSKPRTEIFIDDDCSVYFLKLVVVRKYKEGDEERGHAESGIKLFWPAAHRTRIERFSDALVLYWPSRCIYMTEGWRLDIRGGGGRDDDWMMIHDLKGENPIQIAVLDHCSLFNLELTSEGHSLWQFDGVATLPRPNFDIRPAMNSISVQILQKSCDDKAKIKDWRITYCEHATVEDNISKDEKGQGQEDEETEEEEGSGEGSLTDLLDFHEYEEDEEIYFYYEDAGGVNKRHDKFSNSEMNSVQNCVHKHVALNASQLSGTADEGRKASAVELAGLEKCTLYTLEIVAADDEGQTLQPGEQYGTIYSTLCYGGAEKTESDLWFETEELPEFIADDYVTKSETEEKSSKNVVWISILGVLLVMALAVAIFVILKREGLIRSPNRRRNNNSYVQRNEDSHFHQTKMEKSHEEEDEEVETSCFRATSMSPKRAASTAVVRPEYSTQRISVQSNPLLSNKHRMEEDNSITGSVEEEEGTTTATECLNQSSLLFITQNKAAADSTNTSVQSMSPIHSNL